MDEAPRKSVLQGRLMAVGAPYVRPTALIGLAETIAWIAMRDSAYCDFVRAFRDHEIVEHARELGVILGEARFAEAVLWQSICKDADTIGVLNYRDAQAELFDAAQVPGGLVGRGRINGSNWQPIPSDEWIGATIIFTEAGDVLAPFASDMGITGPPWETVQFVRQEVLERWPQITDIAREPASAAPVLRDAECQRVAAALDASNVRKRDVKAAQIAALWDSKAGPVVSVPAIQSLMVGGGKGGRPPRLK